MKFGKIYWIIAGSLCTLGAAAMVTAFCLGLNSSYSNEASLTASRTFEDAKDIDILVENCTLDISVSDTAKQISVDFTDVSGNPVAELSNEKLTIRNKMPINIHLFSFGLRNLKKSGNIKIVLPEKTYRNVLLDLDAVKSGKISGITASEFKSDFDAVNITLENITAEESKTDFDFDAVSVKIDNCKFSGGLTINADAGDVKFSGTETSGKFIGDFDAVQVNFDSCSFCDTDIDSDAGKLNFDKTILEGNMKLDMDAGSSDIRIASPRKNFSIFTDADAGKITVDGNSGGMTNADAKYTINITSDAANVNLSFME